MIVLQEIKPRLRRVRMYPELCHTVTSTPRPEACRLDPPFDINLHLADHADVEDLTQALGVTWGAGRLLGGE